jgi:dTDP-4-dehydrorhamnose 3,5-epimerase
MPTRLEPTKLSGAYIIRPSEFTDARGAFYVLCESAWLKQAGINSEFLQQSQSVSKKGVVRGLHYQEGKYAQAKLVRCTHGRIWDVIVDLRRSSPTFGKWEAFELSDENRLALYIPRGFAHGFAALTEGAAVLYQLDNDYLPAKERGVRYDDPQLAIPWPASKPLLSQKDLGWPLLKDASTFE